MGACAGLHCRRAMARRRAGRGQYLAGLAALRRFAAHGDLLPLFLGPDGATAGTGSDRVGVPLRTSADQPDTEGVAAYRLTGGHGWIRGRDYITTSFVLYKRDNYKV